MAAKQQVVFVLGGPGAGKGTQCAKLVEEFGFLHLSAGDLLRNEIDTKGPSAELISEYIRNGAIVPMEITIGLLKRAMEARPEIETVLIDGFPRAMDQCQAFEEAISPCKFCLFFDCPEEVMEQRLLKRGETSGRSDDNMESIRKRFRTYVTQTTPVIEFFASQGRVRKVMATSSAAEVYQQVRSFFLPEVVA